MIQSKIGQRLLGVLLLVLGGGFTVWSWYTVLTEGYYYRNAVALFPAFAVLGVNRGMRDERCKEGKKGRESFSGIMTTRNHLSP